MQSILVLSHRIEPARTVLAGTLGYAVTLPESSRENMLDEDPFVAGAGQPI